MREIKYRGKRADGGGWIEDSETYIHDGDGVWLSDDERNVVQVMPETVGQYTGLLDKNGTKIFEGDIVAYEDANADFEGYHDNVFVNRGTICFSDGCYYVGNKQTVTEDDLIYNGEMNCEVIGNIHDSPEILFS